MPITETSLPFGRLSGVPMDGYTVFRGVPYAQPPVGDLRWRAPQPCLPWTGVRKADTFPPACPQPLAEVDSFYGKEFYSTPDRRPTEDEDCLYLNIWTPAASPEDRLPVALWIHGGAFDHGFGHEAEFDGEALCRRGVILVTIHYRVGVFGFLNHPALRQEDPEGRSGNYGCLDQIAALRWVHDNIAAFGGDPDRISVFGQSAGAMSTQVLISSRLTRGLIAGAVLQSGAGYRNGLADWRTPEEAEAIGTEFISGLCGPTAAEMRSLSAQTLLESFRQYAAAHPEHPLPFMPVVDGYVLEDTPDGCIDRGLIPPMPCMIGSTLNDIGTDPAALAAGDRGLLYGGVLRFAEKEAGSRKVFVYDFIRQLPGDDRGAFHSSELWYVFGTLGRCWRPMTEGDHRLSRAMTDAWAAFFRTGDPSLSDASWPAWTPENGYIRVWDV